MIIMVLISKAMSPIRFNIAFIPDLLACVRVYQSCIVDKPNSYTH